MRRQVSHDGKDTLEIRFPFDRQLVELIKTLPHRRWNATERFWYVPDSDVVLLVDLLHAESFGFDEATRALYADRGGHSALDESARPELSRAAPRGLFDGPPEPVAQPETRRAESADLTVSTLNARVRSVLDAAFPAPVWLVGEIQGFEKSSHRRHVGFELVERGPGGEAVSKIPVTLFESTREEVRHALRLAGDPFRLEDELTVRLLVRVDLHVPWGAYRVVVERLDVHYTLGEAARRREEILRRLSDAGLVERNRVLPLAAWPLRVALVTSVGSDAYNDVLRTLQESRFAFRVTAHDARVQGHATERSVLHALAWVRSRQADFDVVLICRGGGARTDLIWFDSEPLGRAVAEFPLPVVVGIGHEQDRSVLDAVARSCKTPTAAAALLVQTVRDAQESLETLGQRILGAAARITGEQARRGVERAMRLVRAARGLLELETTRVTHRRQRAVSASRALLAAARVRQARWSEGIPRGSTMLIQARRAVVDGARRAIRLGARRELTVSRRRLDEFAAGVGPRASRLLSRHVERLEQRARRLQLADPRRVVERGYALLRGADGTVVSDAAAAPPGSLLQAELRRGTLRLRSEGAVRKAKKENERHGGD